MTAEDPFASVDAALDRGDVGAAMDGFSAILEEIDRRGGAQTPDDKLLRAEVYGRTAAIFDQVGDYPRARLGYLHQTELLSELVPDDDIALLRARYNAAEIANVSGDKTRALAEFDLVRPALADSAETDPEARILLTLLDKNRGRALEGLDRYAEAEESYGRALAATTDPEPRLVLEVGVAHVRRKQGRPVDAERLVQRLAEVEAAGDPTSTRTLALAARVAGLLPDERRVALYERVIAALPRDSTGEELRVRGTALVDLTTVHLDNGDRDATLDTATEAASIAERVYANDVRSGGTLSRPIDPTWPMAIFLAAALRLPGPERPEAVLALHRAATGYKRGQAELLLAQYQLALADPNLRSLVTEVRALRSGTTGAEEGDPFGTLEAAQAAALPTEVVEQMFERSSAASIATELSPETALVEYVALRGASWDEERSSVPARYGAFVLVADQPPAWVDLADSADVEAAAAALVAAIPGAEGRRLRPVAAAQGDWRTAAASLAELVWAPVTAAVGPRTNVVIAPDAALCSVPFDVLPDGPDGAPLLATRTVSLVGTGRDLVRLTHRANARALAPLVVAAPDFGQPVTRFDPLPGTVTEGAAIAEALGVEALTGPAATRETVLAAVNPEIVHLATHGYAGGLDDDHRLGPLADCGVALAGANTAGPLSRNGVLTGLDVLSMRLDGTDLVVLSACDTGLGELDDYEGLQGLARSFFLGGARAVVSSLWKVSDSATAELMADYYRRLMAERSRAWALADAKRAAYLAAPDRPELWGAFVSTGDPGPLVRHGYLSVAPDQMPEHQGELHDGVGRVGTGEQLWEAAEFRLTEDGEPVRMVTASFAGSYLAGVDEELRDGFESMRAGDVEAALRHAEAAMAELEEGDRGRGQGRERRARALALHALALATSGDYESARKKGLAAVAAYEQLDAWPDLLAVALDNLAITEINLGLVDQGIQRLEESLALKLGTLPVDLEQVDFTRGVLAEIERQQAEGRQPARRRRLTGRRADRR